MAHRKRVCVAQLSYSRDFRWFGLLRPQFAIYWFLGDLGTERNFAAPFRPRKGAKTPKSGFSRSWGPFWARCPPTKVVCMLNADPVNPVWGPMCPWGLGYGRFWGRWGPFRQLGTGSVCYGPNRQKTVLAIARRHQGVFGNVLAHRNRVRGAQLSYSDDVGGFHPSFFFSRKSRSTGFWRGLGT